MTIFFTTFEIIANTLKWPTEFWSNLLQQIFTGRSLCVFASVPDSDAKVSKTVKDEALKVYAPVPDTYRQSFRGLRSRPTLSSPGARERFFRDDFAPRKGVSLISC